MDPGIEPGGKKRLTRSRTQRNINGTVYCESTGFCPGFLPTSKDIVQAMLYLLRPDRAGKLARTAQEAARLLAYALISHWEYCNVYTIHIQHVQKKIFKVYEVFKTNAKTAVTRWTDNWKNKMDDYNLNMAKLFDIFCSDEVARQKKEEKTGVQMGHDEWEFLEDMRSSRKMYNEDFIDNAWQAEQDNLLEKERRYERLQKAKREEEDRVKKVSWSNVVLDGDKENNEGGDRPDPDENCNDENFAAEADETVVETSKETKKTKRKRVSEPSTIIADPLPSEFRHIRHNVNVVKPEFYTTTDRIKAELHCSARQASGAVILTGNGLFGRNWKSHDQDSSTIDLDTAPHVKQMRETGQALTALCLGEIVNEMMEAGGGVITYHDDGSRSQGVGGYSVQGITINQKFRPFPTLPVASECRTNLAALKSAILSILAACNDNYTALDIYNAVTFKVTDDFSRQRSLRE